MVRLPSKSTLFPYTTLFRSSATLLAAILGMLGLARTAVKRRSSPRHRSGTTRSEEHTSELQSRGHLVCRLLLEKKKTNPQKQQQPQSKSSAASWCHNTRR